LNKKIIKLQILIDKTGKIKDVSVLKSIDQELDQQIVKIIKNMPDWNPGEDPNGRPTDTRVKIIIRVTPEKVKVIRQTYDEVEITMDNK
jgi:protein TonB